MLFFVFKYAEIAISLHEICGSFPSILARLRLVVLNKVLTLIWIVDRSRSGLLELWCFLRAEVKIWKADLVVLLLFKILRWLRWHLNIRWLLVNWDIFMLKLLLIDRHLLAISLV